METQFRKRNDDQEQEDETIISKPEKTIIRKWKQGLGFIGNNY